MANHYKERYAGSIRGLRLPLPAWNGLQEAGITTIDQLKAAADRLERLPGIGVRLARVIREELARVSAIE
jgi:endonuclease III